MARAANTPYSPNIYSCQLAWPAPSAMPLADNNNVSGSSANPNADGIKPSDPNSPATYYKSDGSFVSYWNVSSQLWVP